MTPNAPCPARRPRSGAPLPEDLRTALSELVGRLGESEACARVGVSRATFARALSGLGVNAGTVSLIRNALGARS
jgi:hypothetical protein